jgi:hypothetical protein
VIVLLSTRIDGKNFMKNMSSTVRHIVVFKNKDGTLSDQIQQVTNAFRALQTQIPGILSFEYGINNSPEGANLGFTHVYTLTFKNVNALDSYLPHPQHLLFGELLRRLDILADAFVVDYNPSP